MSLLTLTVVVASAAPVGATPAQKVVESSWTASISSIDQFVDEAVENTCETGSIPIADLVKRFPNLARDPKFAELLVGDGVSFANGLCDGGACGCGICMNIPNVGQQCAACAACCAAGQEAWCNCTGNLATQVITASCGCSYPKNDTDDFRDLDHLVPGDAVDLPGGGDGDEDPGDGGIDELVIDTPYDPWEVGLLPWTGSPVEGDFGVFSTPGHAH